jgi:hypothetical protein
LQEKRRARAIVATVATLGVGFIGLLALPALAPERAEAHGTYVPAHQLGRSYYDNYGLHTYWPRYMMPYYNVSCTRGGERVYWSPDLYRWNGYQWVLYNGSAPWYRAITASNSGPILPSQYCPLAYGAIWIDPNGYSISPFGYPFRQLPVGYYAIKNYMYWGSIGRDHNQWSDVFRLYSTSAGSKAAAKTNGSQPPAPRRANSEGGRKAPPPLTGPSAPPR